MAKTFEKIQQASGFMRWSSQYDKEDDQVYINDKDFIDDSEKAKEFWDKQFKNLDKNAVNYMQELIQKQQGYKDEVLSLAKQRSVLETRIQDMNEELANLKQ